MNINQYLTFVSIVRITSEDSELKEKFDKSLLGERNNYKFLISY